MAVLQKLEAAGVSLNPTKCKFGKALVKFLGDLLHKNAFSADTNMTLAILLWNL